VTGERVSTTTQPQRGARTNNESVWRIMRAATRRERVARAMMMAMRVVGKVKGGGSKGHGVGDKGGMQQRQQWQWQQECWQQGWQVSNSNWGNGDGNVNNVDNLNRDKAGG
jgi:hypothetical protein